MNFMHTHWTRDCVYNTLTEYLSRTKDLRGNQECLFISYIKPFGPVSSNTISRWIRTVISSSGIDCSKYKAHSVRSASTSKANVNNVPISDILKVAGWTNAVTFAQFYKKTVKDAGAEFSSAILSTTETL